MSSFSIVQKRAFTSAFAAVALHLLVLGLWMAAIVLDLRGFAPQPLEIDHKVEPEVTVVMIPYSSKPFPVIQEVPEPEAEPKEAEETGPKDEPLLAEEAQDEKEGLKEVKQRFARTTADQEGLPDAETEILGERNTRAASELPTTLGAKPNTPAQDGAVPLYPGQMETVDKAYQEGSLGKDSLGVDTEVPQEASKANSRNERDEAKPSTDPLVDSSSSLQDQNKHLAQGTKMSSAKVVNDNSEVEEIQEKENPSDDLPKEQANDLSEKESEQEQGSGDVEQDPKKDGFQGYSRQTRVTGSISRQGESALNVRNSPLGRYQALISKAVELQWRRNCEQHRDHIVPGVISIRFYVDQSGGVSGIKFQEVIGANFIERGFTQRALRQVELPNMPESVQEELKGESLELIYNFYF